MTLDQAIALALRNEPAFTATKAEREALALERINARAALLPSATYHNLALYTKPNGVPASRIGQTTNAPSPAFIANNAIREYASQGVFNETVGFAQVAAVHLADANAARADAELEIARRGLVAGVADLFFSFTSAQAKILVAQRALNEANHFLEITERREAAREAAHADVLKARLQQQLRAREILDDQLVVDKARLELAVLLYPDPLQPFTALSEDAIPPLPERAGINRLAGERNPEIRSAFASLRATQADVYASRAALAPDLALNFTYGIDATNFGTNGPDGIRNLGYSLSAQIDLPVWDWLATERRIKASHLREAAAKIALTGAQRRLLANLSEFYAEAEGANRQLASLDQSAMTARESLRLTNLRYVDGESSALEVVDGQNALIASENAQIDGRLRYQLALAGLQTLTGRF